MKSAENNIKPPARYLSKVSAALLWLMLIVLPAIGGKIIFSAAMNMENQLENSRMRQKFSIELQKYSTALEPRTWLRNALSAESFDKFITRLYKGEATRQEFSNHPFLRGIPDFTASVSVEIARFASHFQKMVGCQPDVVFIMAPQETDCGWQIRKPFANPPDEQKMRQSLKQAWKKLSERLEIKMNHVPDNLRSLTEQPELSNTLGLFDFVSTGMGIAKDHFSIKNNSEIFISILPVPEKDGRFNKRFILFAISTASLTPRFMLKKTCNEFSNTLSEHSFGESRQELLPLYTNEDGRLALIGSTPESFQKLAWKHAQYGKKPLAIKISERKPTGISKLKLPLANAALMIYVMIATLTMAGIRTGRFKSFQKIQRLVAAGLFAGILLPLSGTTWLGMCYLNTRRHLEAESTMNWMQNAIFVKDQAIKLQLTRNVLFRNLFAEIMSGMTPETLQKLNNRVGFYEPESSMKNLPYYAPVNDRIETFAIYHPELDDLIGMNNNRKKITETPHLFFGSHAREVIFQLGAMNQLPPERVRQMLNRTQYTMGFLDNVLDSKMVSKVFAEEKSALNNAMSTRREQMTASFWKGPENSVKGLSIIQTTNSCWYSDLARMLKNGMIKQHFSYNGYRIFLHIYLRHSYHHRKLIDQSEKTQVLERFSADSVWPLAEALYSFGDYARINNLDAQKPHLILAEPAADGDVWIMGIAEPENANGLFSGNTALAGLALLAIFCSLVLARGLSRVLLRPISALEEAVYEMGRQNFNFMLQIRNGDEFDLLGDSFNQASRKLYERAKLSRLVSRNVLDAVSAAEDQLLKPGGSRVEASILFSDLRGFTTISENNPPEAVVSMLNDYFSLMAEIIERHGGLIDKLIGDAIQAVFYAHENDNCAESAVKAGLEMRSSLAEFNRQRHAQALFTVDNGVGICTGTVICGCVGSEHGMLDATIIGSLVNRAAHMESLSKHGTSSKVFIDEATGAVLPPIYARHEQPTAKTGIHAIELQI